MSKNGVTKTKKVHRLVAEAFIKKPEDCNNVIYEVNHKDCNRTNNNINNLEWLVHKENVYYSINQGNHFCTKNLNGSNNPNYGNNKLSIIYKNNKELAKLKQSRPGSKNGNAHPVILFDKNHNYIKNFDCLISCAEYLIANGYSKSNPKSLSLNISSAIKTKKLYIKHYFETA